MLLFNFDREGANSAHRRHAETLTSVCTTLGSIWREFSVFPLLPASRLLWPHSKTTRSAQGYAEASRDWSASGDPAIGEQILRQYLTMEAMHSGAGFLETEPTPTHFSENSSSAIHHRPPGSGDEEDPLSPAKRHKGAEVSQLQVDLSRNFAHFLISCVFSPP